MMIERMIQRLRLVARAKGNVMRRYRYRHTWRVLSSCEKAQLDRNARVSEHVLPNHSIETNISEAAFFGAPPCHLFPPCSRRYGHYRYLHFILFNCKNLSSLSLPRVWYCLGHRIKRSENWRTPIESNLRANCEHRMSRHCGGLIKSRRIEGLKGLDCAWDWKGYRKDGIRKIIDLFIFVDTFIQRGMEVAVFFSNRASLFKAQRQINTLGGAR